MANSNRFVSAYNKIDKALRNRYNFKANLTFTDVVRKAASQNEYVRRCEDDLYSFSRLRNAIVHNSDDSAVIAEPHDNVTAQIEHIAALIAKPPKAATFAHEAVSVAADIPLNEVIQLMARGDYSNVPVFKDGSVIGVVTNKMIVNAVEKNFGGDIGSFIFHTPVERILTDNARHFRIIRADIAVDEAIKIFSDNRKLAILLLSGNGGADGEILGVLTISDLPALSEAME